MSTAPRPGRPDEPSPWRGVELLERAIGYTRGTLGLVTADLMGADTPCAGWDLRTLLQHMDDSLASLSEAGASQSVGLAVAPLDRDDPAATDAPLRGDDPVDRLRVRACRLLGDWSAAEQLRVDGTRRDVLVEGRPLTSPVLTSAGALEIAVHGWDVSVACGAPRPLPDDLATALLRLAPVLVADCDRPVRFAPALTPPTDASPGERVLAFLGREPRPWPRLAGG